MNLREQELFDSVRLMPKGEARKSFLDTHCAYDPSARRAVEGFLEDEEAANKYFEEGAKALGLLALTPDAFLPDEFSSGDRIGCYRILEKIGEGGFGKVYRAEQEEPVNRKVALKIIKAGMDTQQVIARFEAERQALSMMDHPNIAKVLDAGATEQGRPYFVMGLVQGVPITKYCDQHLLTIKERLNLFISVCHAIQHAHQKGIIHRDIKPSNVLVSHGNGEPYPMIIDFGVAKAINQRLTEKTLFTNFAHLIGTPAYMSPEQAEMSRQDVDTRADVYALGILLYELLTGTTPFPEERLKEVGVVEMQRIICEEEPHRPSMAWSRLDGKSRRVAENRRCEPVELMRLIKGDLDWIILKAIDKDRTRRYDSVSDFASDIRSFLSNQPVAAVPPTAHYLLHKFAKRHRTLILTGSGIAVAMILGLVLALAGFSKANSERRKAELEAKNSAAMLAFLSDDLLAGADLFRAAEKRFRTDRDIKLMTVIQQAGLQLSRRFAEQPLVEASLRLTIGRALERLGEVEEARSHLHRAAEIYGREYGKNSAEYLSAQHALAWLNYTEGNFAEAIAAHEEVLAQRKNVLPPGSAEIYESMNGLATACLEDTAAYDKAENMFQQILLDAPLYLDRDHFVILSARAGLSKYYYKTAAKDDSIRLSRGLAEAMARQLGSDHPQTIRMAALEVFYHRVNGDLRTAARLNKTVLERSLRVLGEDDECTHLLIQETSQYDEQQGLWGKALDGRLDLARILSEGKPLDDMGSLWAKDLLGGCLRGIGDYPEAEDVLRSNTVIRLSTGQTSTIEQQRSQRFLAWAIMHQGRVEEAADHYRQVFEQNVSVFGLMGRRTVLSAGDLVRLEAMQGKWRLVADIFRELAQVSLQNPLSTHPFGALPVPSGILVAQLDGDQPLSDELLRQVAEFGIESTNTSVLIQIADAILALDASKIPLKLHGAIQQIMERAPRSHGYIASEELRGLAVNFRQTHYQLAAKLAEPLTRNPDNLIAARSGYFYAMALWHDGSKESAKVALHEASFRLHVALRPGFLGHGGQNDQSYDLRWAQFAGCFLLRNEAEKLIDGEITSGHVDAGLLNVMRMAWQPTQARLDAMERLARARDWSGAHDQLLAALDHGPISWDHLGNQIIQLSLKAAVVFALNDQLEQYQAFCRDRIEHAHESQVYLARNLHLLPGVLSPEHSTKVLSMLQRRADELEESQSRIVWNDWVWLELGTAQYRLGNHAESLQTLARAREAFNLSWSGAACAISAMAAHQMGRHDEAAEFLATAQGQFQQVLDGNYYGLSRYWHDVGAFELAVKEAEKLIND